MRPAAFLWPLRVQRNSCLIALGWRILSLASPMASEVLWLLLYDRENYFIVIGWEQVNLSFILICTRVRYYLSHIISE